MEGSLAKTTESSKSKKKEKNIHAIADLAAKKAVEEFESSKDEDDTDNDEIDTDIDAFGDDGSPLHESLSNFDGDAQDVFIEAFAKAQARNETAKYSLYRNGEMIATKYHPYSWETLQKEYGAGHYKVVARDSRGKYLTAQSQLVGSPHNDVEAPEITPLPQQNQSLSFMEMWTLMNGEKEKTEREIKEQAASAATAQADMFKAMMMMSQQSQQQSQQMMMTLLQQMNQNTVQMMQAMNEKMTMMNQHKKDDGIDPLKLQLLLQEAEKRAEERMRFMFEQIENKAEAMAEEKAELLANQNENGEKESLTSQLIKGFIPLIANAASVMPQLHAPQSHLPEPVTQLPSRNAASLPQTPKIQPNSAPQPPVPPATKNLNPKPVVQTAKTAQPKKEEKPVNSLKTAILDLTLPLIGNGLLKRQAAKEVAGEAIKTLEKVGISRQNVMDNFTFDDILALAKEYNIPAMANGWLKEFHEALLQPINPTPSPVGAAS